MGASDPADERPTVEVYAANTADDEGSNADADTFVSADISAKWFAPALSYNPATFLNMVNRVCVLNPAIE